MSWRSGSWPGLTPPLCERCWFPVPARDAIIYPIRPPGAEVVDDDAYGFAHPGEACTPQQAGAGQAQPPPPTTG